VQYLPNEETFLPRFPQLGGNWDARREQEESEMLNWSLTFLIVALVAAVFGFTGVALAAAGAAKILFVLFLVLFLISLVAGTVRRT
jgi:uncharacterized membrane protein YtjA (UPF0391 family)